MQLLPERPPSSCAKQPHSLCANNAHLELLQALDSELLQFAERQLGYTSWNSRHSGPSHPGALQ